MEPRILASQLRCPSGTEALDVALKMNEANRLLNQKCIDLLQLKSGDSLLEIGPGNGAFVADIIKVAENISYMGLDWSDDMVVEAQRLNEYWVKQGRAQFQQGSSEHLPFATGLFNKVLTVHTLYFWEKPSDHLAQIRRVMKPAGLFCIAFGDSSFMKELSFVPYGFNLYDEAEVCALLRSSGFRVVTTAHHQERGLSNTGDLVDKIINIIICEA